MEKHLLSIQLFLYLKYSKYYFLIEIRSGDAFN